MKMRKILVTGGCGPIGSELVMELRGKYSGNSETPITPVMLGDAKLARSFSQRLFEEGIFAQAISYPTVVMDKARIRVMISAAHSHKDLDFALGVFGRVGEELRVL